MAGTYPPDRHVLRDLGLWIERDEGGSQAGLEVVPELCHPAGGIRAGVLATLVDAAGGDMAVREARPDWVATSDLVLHVVNAPARGSVLARPELLRRTRTTLVIEVGIRGAAGELVGLATMTFAVLAARGHVQRMGAGANEPRTDFGAPGSGLREALPARLGVRPVAGGVELPLSDYVINSLGGLQGGMVAVLADLAAEEATGGPVVDLAVNFLSLGRTGPFRTSHRVLRSGPHGSLARVELRDTGADDRLFAVATASTSG